MKMDDINLKNVLVTFSVAILIRLVIKPELAIILAYASTLAAIFFIYVNEITKDKRTFSDLKVIIEDESNYHKSKALELSKKIEALETKLESFKEVEAQLVKQSEDTKKMLSEQSFALGFTRPKR